MKTQLVAALLLAAVAWPGTAQTTLTNRAGAPLRLIRPVTGRIFLPTPRQHKLPGAAFVADGQDLVSTNSVWRVRIGPNIRARGAVSVLTPEKHLLVGQPLALSFYDPVAQTNVLLAELKDPTARLVNSNCVVFTDCWNNDIKADIVYSLERRNFSQGVVVKGTLPDPAFWGLNTNNVRLQVWSEFYEPPEPVKTERVLKEISPGLVWKDETLAFGQSRMVPGRAFLADLSTNLFPVINPRNTTDSQSAYSMKKWQKTPAGFPIKPPRLITTAWATFGKPSFLMAVASPTCILLRANWRPISVPAPTRWLTPTITLAV